VDPLQVAQVILHAVQLLLDESAKVPVGQADEATQLDPLKYNPEIHPVHEVATLEQVAQEESQVRH
jgi:hypothetical protein